MAVEIDINTVAKAYARWAPVYDFVFGAVFDAGRKASIAAAQRIGGRILDVGIGTGISLLDYAPAHRIVGVDYSEPMLRKAHERVAAHQLGHVDALAVMDAQQLGFPDGFFDAVVAQYVITTVPDPEAALDEFARVTKPGGEIILVNHLGAEFRATPPVRAGLCADGAPTRLAAGIPLGTAGTMGRAARRSARTRTPPDATARAFLADPVRAEGGGYGRPGKADRGRASLRTGQGGLAPRNGLRPAATSRCVDLYAIVPGRNCRLESCPG